jgi:hypothetical protein
MRRTWSRSWRKRWECNSNFIVIEADWQSVEAFFTRISGKVPDLDGMLFLVGVQELGKGPGSFSKEQKQDLMHVGMCTILTKEGYYKPTHRDEDGWPHFELVKPIPLLTLDEQEVFFRERLVEYLRPYLD